MPPCRLSSPDRPRIGFRLLCFPTVYLPLLATLLSPARPLAAEIAVNGITDKTVYANRAWFHVPTTAGFQYVARLDGIPVPLDQTNRVTDVDYHELVIQRTPAGATTNESRKVRFIVKSTERGDTEWGLPPWTPPPVIDSTAAELAPGELRLLIPSSFPAGMEIPLAAWLIGPDGHALRANAKLVSSAHAPIQLRRGAGSGWITPPTSRGTLTYTANLPGREFSRVLNIEPSTVWRTMGGSLTNGDLTWPAGARIEITNHVVIAAGRTLSIGSGSVVRLAPGANIEVFGSVKLDGTTTDPVALVAIDRSRPWGGFLVRTNASVAATATLFADSGADPTWFITNTGYDVHRKEQALFLVDGGHVELTDCAAFDGHGQFGHGREASLVLHRTLVQRFITGGEYSGGAVRIHDSALIEFPRDNGTFADADNDGIYFTTGQHVIADSVIGWAKDDGIDAGSGGAGSVLATNVWVEATYHEAFAWSGRSRHVTNIQCVAYHCGQGIECGWSTGTNSPLVEAVRCLSLENLVGVRFGDNYDWTYNGFLRVTNSLILHNRRDIFGFNWGDWTYRTDQMDLQGNLLTSANHTHPANTAWQPASDAPRLDAFSNVPAGAPPGIGLAVRPDRTDVGILPAGIAVALSRFASHVVTVDYAVESNAGVESHGTLAFQPGETLKSLPINPVAAGGTSIRRLRLGKSVGGELTGETEMYLTPRSPDSVVLVPTGSEWRYRDNGVDPGPTWTSPAYDDSKWKSGFAELGFGDDDEVTTIAGGPTGARHITAWFRRAVPLPDPSQFAELEVRVRRDDGAVVHVNGAEVYRSNLPDGAISATTLAVSASTSETAYFSQRFPAAVLKPGENLIAVEVHQATVTSGDMSFDLELAAFPKLPLAWERFGSDTILYWSNAAGRLEAADSPNGPWRPGPESPGTALKLEAGNPTFYRLTHR